MSTMQRIVVSPVEAELIRTAGKSVHVVDAAGKIVGYITPAPPDDEVERVKNWLVDEKDSPVYSAEQVTQNLQSLETS